MNPVARRLSLLSSLLLAGTALFADSFTHSQAVDFFRDVPSRKLRGFAARSDGRLVAGPVLRDLGGELPADILWCLAPGPDASTWYVGSGPEGLLLELKLDAAASKTTVRQVAKLDDSQVFAVATLPDGSILAGTSPHGKLVLLREGKVLASVQLPADSVFDILPPEQPGAPALVATGNPAQLYAVDPAVFAKAGVTDAKLAPVEFEKKGLRLFGEVKDKNLRRLARLPDGRVLGGSAPRGNIYAFPKDGGAPVILMENRDAEVTDLLVTPKGNLFASLVLSGISGENRINRNGRNSTGNAQAPGVQTIQIPPGPSPVQGPVQLTEQVNTGENAASASLEKFQGRSQLVYLPVGGLPEVVVTRTGLSVYRLAMQGGIVLLSGGEQGDVFGYDPERRLSLTFAGSSSAQLNDMRAVKDRTGLFLLLRNNPAGVALLDFQTKETRSAETRKLDLVTSGKVGALRLGRPTQLAAEALTMDMRSSLGSEEAEGWTPWSKMKPEAPSAVGADSWTPPADTQARYLRLRLSAPATLPEGAEIDKADWFHTPQDRRPVLSEFRMLSPGFALALPNDQSQPLQTLGQVLGSGLEATDKRRSTPNASQLVPAPGIQVFLWSLGDADGDTLSADFSIRREGTQDWIPLVVSTQQTFVQIDISHLEEGLYHTRLFVKEEAPRPQAERQNVNFETDDLIIDRTAPEILEAKAERKNGRLVVTVRGRDALSLVQGLSACLNNGPQTETENPLDGVRDSREESFEVDFSEAEASGATQVEVSLFDALGNRRTKLLRLSK